MTSASSHAMRPRCYSLRRPPGRALARGIVLALVAVGCGTGCVCVGRSLSFVYLTLDRDAIPVGQVAEAMAEVQATAEGVLAAEPTAPPRSMEVTFIAVPEGIVQLSGTSAWTDRDGMASVTVAGLAPGDAMVMAGTAGEYAAPVFVHVDEGSAAMPG